MPPVVMHFLHELCQSGEEFVVSDLKQSTAHAFGVHGGAFRDQKAEATLGPGDPVIDKLPGGRSILVDIFGVHGGDSKTVFYLHAADGNRQSKLSCTTFYAILPLIPVFSTVIVSSCGGSGHR